MPCRNTSPCHTPDNRRYRYPSLWMLRTRHTGRPPTTVKIYRGGMGLLTPEGPAVDAEEEAFIRAMKRKKKKKRKGLGM